MGSNAYPGHGSYPGSGNQLRELVILGHSNQRLYPVGSGSHTLPLTTTCPVELSFRAFLFSRGDIYWNPAPDWGAAARQET